MRDREVIGSMARTMFAQQGWSALDNAASSYRTSGMKTASGVWMLSCFYAGFDQLAGFRMRSPNLWEALDREMAAWQRASPSSPAARIARASLMAQRAWNDRGSQYASAESNERLKLFEKEIRRTRSYLERSKGVAAVDPHWYVLMEDIAVAQRWSNEEFDRLFDEATRRHPQYLPIYTAAARRVLPQWGGTPQDLDRVARLAVERTKATDAEALYVRVYWTAFTENRYLAEIRRDQLDWPTLSRSIDDVLTRYPDPWNLNHFASFACLAGDRAKTRTLLGRLGSDINLSGWCSRDFYEKCKAWAAPAVADNPAASDNPPDEHTVCGVDE